MNSSGTKDPANIPPARWWFFGILAVLALTLAIRPESYWTDELTSAFLAAQSDWQRMIFHLNELGSEAQMPLHVAWLWLWARLFGTGEWALRASNIPWAILAVFAWTGLLRRRSFGIWAIGLLLSPFICYYMNEARPYMMSFAAGMLALYAAESLCSNSMESGPAHKAAMLAGLGLCAGASMLNLILVPSLAVYVSLRLSDGAVAGGWRIWIRHHKGALGGLAALLTCMACYYCFTLLQGHKGQREPFVWLNAAYALYEMLGFGGLGAPRILLRELSLAKILSGYGVTLAAGLVVWGSIAGVLWARRREVSRDPIVRAAVASLAFGVLALAGAAIIGKASLWGRHFMMMLPLLLWSLAGALETARKVSPAAARGAIFALIGLFVFSSVRQRGLDEYRKDPLREAVRELGTIVRRTPAMPVAVVSSPLAVWRYGGDATPALTPVLGWPEDRSRKWQAGHPAYILLMHRADKFDPGGVWARQLSSASGATLLWSAGNVKIYRVGTAPAAKGIL